MPSLSCSQKKEGEDRAQSHDGGQGLGWYELSQRENLEEQQRREPRKDGVFSRVVRPRERREERT